MAIVFQCSCGQQMQAADEHAGLKVRCPGCQGILIVPGQRRAPVVRRVERQEIIPEDDYEDDYRPRRKRGTSIREGLHRATIGLGLHWWKAFCFAFLWGFGLLFSLTLLMLTIAAAISRAAGTPLDGRVAVIVIGLLGCVSVVVFLVMPVLSAVGSLMCFWLPMRSGGRVLSMVACGLDTSGLLFVLLALAVIFSASTMGPRRVPDVFSASGFSALFMILAYLLMLAGWILHMLVLKNLAEYRADRYVAGDAVRMLIVGLVILVVPAILIWSLGQLIVPGGLVWLFVVTALLCAWTGSMLGVSIKLLNLTATVRHLL